MHQAACKHAHSVNSWCCASFAAYRILAARVEALDFEAFTTASEGASKVEGIGLTQGSNAPVGVLGFVHDAIATGTLQQVGTIS